MEPVINNPRDPPGISRLEPIASATSLRKISSGVFNAVNRKISESTAPSYAALRDDRLGSPRVELRADNNESTTTTRARKISRVLYGPDYAAPLQDAESARQEINQRISLVQLQSGGAPAFPDHREDLAPNMANGGYSEGYTNPTFVIHDEDENIVDEEEMIVEEDRLGALPTLPSSRNLQLPGEPRSRKISMGYSTAELPPSMSRYGEGSNGDVEKIRPSLDELRAEKAIGEEDLVRNTGNEKKLKKDNLLGWIRGVVLWTILQLWGVMLFLRISWMCAQAGMGLFLVIVLISTCVAILTTLSTSAIATNGEIGMGGTYFMISRSLGPRFGAAIGVIFSIANAISVSLNIQGFADVIVGLYAGGHLPFMVDHVNDNRIIGVITLVLLTGFTFFGMEIASKLQSVFFVILCAAIANIVIGSIIPPNVSEQADGFVGYSSALFRENFHPAFQTDQTGPTTFMTVFGVFFPSVTGILAGTSITGDLRDASAAIPKGTICAILFTSVTYILIGWTTAATTLRHASGNVLDVFNGTLQDCAATQPSNCSRGSINDFEIMETVGHFRPIILAGIFSATLSSALGCINFAPKIFQALCRDKIFPFIHIFGKGYGKTDEPYRAYALVMVIAVAFLMPADLNFIANIVSNCFLLTFALVNYATFDASYSKSPGWRPTFKYYNKWLSLFTGAACIVLMFCLDWMSAVIVCGIIGLLYLYVYYKDPAVNWGTSGQANVYRQALSDSLKLLKIEDHVKNFRPQILVLTGMPWCRPALLYFAQSITRATGLLICGHVLTGEPIQERKALSQEIYKWLRKRKIRAFYDFIAAEKTSQGVAALIQTSGLGKLKPNILMMGYFSSWSDARSEIVHDYVSVIGSALDAHLAVMILYAKEGFDITEILDFEQLVRENAQENGDLNQVVELPEFQTALPLEVRDTKKKALKSRVALAEQFQPSKNKLIKGEVHVWWLYDDGGLTLLTPYLMTRQSPWIGCKIKVFCLAQKNPEEARAGMLSLLGKLRIEVSQIIAIDMEQAPKPDSVDEFHQRISSLREEEHDRHGHRKVSGRGYIRDADLTALGHRTLRLIRFRELLLEHSSASQLNVITLPPPQKSNDGSALYMALLDALTVGLPTTLLVRGTQENVLTVFC